MNFCPAPASHPVVGTLWDAPPMMGQGLRVGIAYHSYPEGRNCASAR